MMPFPHFRTSFMVDQILRKARRVNSFISRMTMANVRARLMGPSAFDFSSYSQSGEDRIIEFFLNTSGLENATYLDIGASHPIASSNTYLLYRRGLRGVCVDPEPGLDRLYKRYRPRDLFMPYAVVAGEEEEVTVHMFMESSLNTVSVDYARQFSGFGFETRQSCRVPAINLHGLVSRIGGDGPDVLSIDIEGLDLEVLARADFSLWRPKLICAEVVRYLDTKQPVIDRRFEQVLEEKGYFKYADTFINQIFVDTEVQSRQRFV
jgi:FkbM family methyltransferase